MKIKYIICFLFILLLCGCENISNLKPEDITADFSSAIEAANTYRTGYDYYLPIGLNVESYGKYSEVLSDGTYPYYLFVDLISYNNKTENTFTPSLDAVYSYPINYDDKHGYLEVNLEKNNQYLIEIMFNYAKIEVMVDSKDLNKSLRYCVSLIQSIHYKDEIINRLLVDDILSYQEEEFNVFSTKSSDSNYLQRLEEDEYHEEKTQNKDSDMLN